jgi:hypothetical protein
MEESVWTRAVKTTRSWYRWALTDREALRHERRDDLLDGQLEALVHLLRADEVAREAQRHGLALVVEKHSGWPARHSVG